MERVLRLSLLLALTLPWMPSASSAQTTSRTAPDATAEEEEVLDDEDSPSADDEASEDGEAAPRLRAPSVEPVTLDPEASAGEGDDESEGEDEETVGESPEDAAEDELPEPEDADRRLDVGGDPTVAPWTTPQTIFELHGYMRMRGEFQDQFSMGRGRANPSQADLPFELFIPREDASVLGGAPAGGCAGGRGATTASCNQRALAFANMRLRLEPTVHLSDDVRVRMQLDVLDNLVLGSTPEGYGVVGSLGFGGSRYDSTYVPITAMAQTQMPPTAGVNSWTNSIVVRRAWAEVRNRGLGELRFGRMGNHWGLGILANGGAGIDADFQSDVDRVMAITRLAGFYMFGAWDFASEGYIYQNPVDYRVPWDAYRSDDVDQMTFGVARRTTPEEQAAALQRGDAVLNGGLFFVYRTQNLTTEGARNPLDPNPNAATAVFRRGFEVYVPDVWVQFLYENLRLEAEAVMFVGTLDNASLGSAPGFTAPNYQVLSFGAAFEGEYHLLNNQLGIYFNSGFATGDANLEGLSRTGDTAQFQRSRGSVGGTDRNLTAFSFHPNYRVDMIFWRTVMRQFSSAYYFRPGISYDFIRSSFGQLLGARADVIWSRASEPVQTWGNQADIGVELDAQAYYRSEDGPDLLDGFYASLQYGIFFPFGALAYLPGAAPGGTFQGGQNAQTLRLILGVQY